jgi:hypothetical protein
VFVLHKPITVSLSVELLVVEDIGGGGGGDGCSSFGQLVLSLDQIGNLR